ncbi:hypothetical protein [Fusibacter sp. 3D3]|uniref:hypothetical protein n=1 Tax=Fusibacter sp. 3D3 TaxID=1048380 RepID=UPI000853EEA9|nr:hypothetical protein [Fusibacter sp. 3D3]GAU78507.1 cell shape-determining protein [Fusibacter sp. 3D3]
MKKVLPLFLGLLLLVVSVYLFMPVLSFNFLQLPFILLIVFFVLFLTTLIGVKQAEDVGFKQKITGGLFIIVLVYMLVALIGSSSFFTWKTKLGELNIKEISTFDESVPNVDMQNLVILDEDDARRASEKLITEKDPSMGSLFQIGEGTLSVVNDKPYWVFPMEYRGFFKWISNRGEIPGFLKVSATNFNEAEFVSYKFAVSPTGYLGDDLKRSLYFQYGQYGLTDFSFEIDDEGKGYWVVTAYTHDTWISTMKVAGTIIVDPVTKEMVYYPVNEQPKWVDRVYSMATFDTQLNWYGKYINGWWNPSDEGKLTDTEGKGYVFKDGEIYFYTGLTSVGKDSATTGFVIYNPRTGEAYYNRISGSIEQKAIGLMEELVQNAGYKASYPYLLNINGEATYFSTLKGNSGNVVGYGFASVQNYKAVAWGKTLREAQTEYNRALLREGGTNALSDQTLDLKNAKGLISRIGTLTEGYYIIKLENDDMLYVVNSEQFPMVSLSSAGDQVTISHLKVDDTGKIDAIDYVNHSIK